MPSHLFRRIIDHAVLIVRKIEIKEHVTRQNANIIRKKERKKERKAETKKDKKKKDMETK